MKYAYRVVCKKRFEPYKVVTVHASDTAEAEEMAWDIMPDYDIYEPMPFTLRPIYYDELVGMGVDEDVAEYMTDMGAPPIEIGNDKRIYIDGSYNIGFSADDLNINKEIIMYE